MLKTEVPSEDTCAQGCSRCALTRLILWQGFGVLWLPSFLAVGSVNLAEIVGLTDTCAFLAHGQALLPRPAVAWSQWMWAGGIGTTSWPFPNVLVS